MLIAAGYQRLTYHKMPVVCLNMKFQNVRLARTVFSHIFSCIISTFMDFMEKNCNGLIVLFARMCVFLFTCRRHMDITDRHLRRCLSELDSCQSGHLK